MTTALSIVAAAQAPSDKSTLPRYSQASTNVFRRFAIDLDKMKEFYGDVVGLGALPAIGMPGGGQMTRFHAGTTEVKLQPSAAEAQVPSGGIRDVTGLRVLTFFVRDEAAVTARFKAHGLPPPEFRPVPGIDVAGTLMSARKSLAADPSGQWVELVVPAVYTADLANRIEIGLTVSDLEKSRAFYRDFVGLKELPAVKDPLLDVTKHPFQLGTTTINLWQAAAGAKKNTTSAGIQYVVVNVEDVDARAKAFAVKIDRPLGPFGTGLRTVWLADPDGITNYFAQVQGRPEVPVP